MVYNIIIYILYIYIYIFIDMELLWSSNEFDPNKYFEKGSTYSAKVTKYLKGMYNFFIY